jgi:hypothetical protein
MLSELESGNVTIAERQLTDKMDFSTHRTFPRKKNAGSHIALPPLSSWGATTATLPSPLRDIVASHKSGSKHIRSSLTRLVCDQERPPELLRLFAASASSPSHRLPFDEQSMHVGHVQPGDFD